MKGRVVVTWGLRYGGDLSGTVLVSDHRARAGEVVLRAVGQSGHRHRPLAGGQHHCSGRGLDRARHGSRDGGR